MLLMISSNVAISKLTRNLVDDDRRFYIFIRRSISDGGTRTLHRTPWPLRQSKDWYSTPFCVRGDAADWWDDITQEGTWLSTLLARWPISTDYSHMGNYSRVQYCLCALPFVIGTTASRRAQNRTSASTRR